MRMDDEMGDRGPGRRRVVMGIATLSILSLAAKLGWVKRVSADDTGSALFAGPARDGRVTLKVPEIAEDGNTVPLSVLVDSPMTDTDHVRAIRIVAARNPQPILATFTMEPAGGRAEIHMRVRLAQTQTVLALAEMSDGTLWSASREIKVTIGGCGGG
jgi:sulfur-oxidizing protein SoxY